MAAWYLVDSCGWSMTTSQIKKKKSTTKTKEKPPKQTKWKKKQHPSQDFIKIYIEKLKKTIKKPT